MSQPRNLRASLVRAIAIPSTFFAALLSGCSNNFVPTPAASAIHLTGNWQLSSPGTTQLPSLSGELTGSGTSITGILHSNSPSACVKSTTAIEMTGVANANQLVTLTGTVGGGSLVITGTLAADGKSIFGASYQVKGGSCAFGVRPATAQAYSSVTGTYAGSFSDPTGQVLSIVATISQSPASDTDGNFELTGSATLPNNPCFNSPTNSTNSQVTGGSFTLTYADPVTQNSVTASGTFSTDASTLTVTSWTLSGPCGPDSGTGLLTKQ